MDTSYLNQLNPTYKVVATKKRFFSKYLYKMTIYAPGCRICADASDSATQELVNMRLETARYHLAARGKWWWRYQHTADLIQNLDLVQLAHIRRITKSNPDIKVRIEEPDISLYFVDFDSMMQTINTMALPERISVVHAPSSVEAADALAEGQVITTLAKDYKFRVQFKESSKMTVEIRQQVLNYLESLGDEVKLTPSCRKQLSSKDSWWFSSTYFYSKSEDNIPFLLMMLPDGVAGIFKLADPS